MLKFVNGATFGYNASGTFPLLFGFPLELERILQSS